MSLQFGMPSQNIYVTNVTIKPFFDTPRANGLSIGSEMSGGGEFGPSP